jgi:DMSO reductase family type II enzyme heme b subunit
MKPLLILVICAFAAHSELRPVTVAQASVEGMLDPAAAAWKSAVPTAIALQRTPLLFPTDQPADLEIPSVELRMVRGGGKTLARLEWTDPSRDTATFAKAERAWQGDHLVKQSEATDRFSDACAIMTPAGAAGEIFPSLQMGDADHPVRIYYWDSSRGAAVMDATGRQTTHRTGKNFPAQASWTTGKWSVVLELPELSPGTPVAIAIWNGKQQDRDGRKYFSIWYKTQ